MGFDVIDKLVEEHRIPQGGVKFNAMYGKGLIGGQQALLMKPLSYMNLSGGPIRDMLHYFKIDPETGKCRWPQWYQRYYQTAWNPEIYSYPYWCRCQTTGMGSGRLCAGAF